MKRPAQQDRGFALAALIIFLTALSITLAAAVPAYRVQVRRELEAELIFRGEEYVRAIQKYQRQFGIYPPSIDSLLETTGIRYLRRAYKDPITGEDFRLLTANPDGTINGSTLSPQQGGNVPLFQGGTPQMFGAPGFGQAGPSERESGGGRGGPGGSAQGRGGLGGGGSQSGFGGGGGFGQQSGFGGQAGAPTGFGQAVTPNSAGFGSLGAFGQPGGSSGQSTPTGFGQAIAPNAGAFGSPGGFGQQTGGGRGGGFGPQARGGQAGGFGAQGRAGPQTGFGPQPGFGQQAGGQQGQGGPGRSGSAGGAPAQPFVSGGVVGVAPTNEEVSLKVYNQRETYVEWEFIAIPGFGAVPAAVSSPGQVPGQASPFQENPTSPFGSGQPNPFSSSQP